MRPEVVFEVSYEAGNEIGGIYTVLNSKSKEVLEEFGDNYILIGPYFQKNKDIEFKIEEPPPKVKEAFDELEKEGIKAYWTSWIEDKDANLILLDVNEFRNKKVRVDYKPGKDIKLNVVKQRLWKEYGVESLFMKEDFNKNVIWAWAAGKTIEELSKLERFSGEKLAHFHEWQSGAGLLYLDLNTQIPTVFTTHSTNLGRTMSSHDPYFMREVFKKLEKEEEVNPQLARNYKIEGKHQMERVCARKASCFTTVSESVAREAEYILGKAPDIITPNALEVKGLEMKRVERKKKGTPSSYESYLVWRLFSRYERYKKEIRELVEAMFWPYWLKSFENVPFVYTSGRYEFKNKGFDLFIDALGEANEMGGKEAVAFIFVPTHRSRIKKNIEKNLLLVDKVEDELGELNLKKEKREELIKSIRERKKPDFIEEEPYSDLRKWFLKLREFEEIPISCFNIPENYRIYSLIKDNGLSNTKEDRIKVVYYPVYLRPGDGVLNLEYYDVINGCDLGVFPSRYEPWGYTPMEAAAFLNSAITTNYAGFGKHLLKTGRSGEGLKVLNMNKGDKQAVENLAKMIDEFINLNREGRNKLRINARTSVLDYNWKNEVKNYFRAYEKALSD